MTIRLAICQRFVPHYRLPVFNLIAKQPGIELTVFAGLDALTTRTDTEDHDFDYRGCDIRKVRPQIGSEHLYRHMGFKTAIAERFDIVILPWSTRFINLVPALRAARRAGVATVLWGHGYSKRPGRIRDIMRNSVVRQADAALLYTHNIADQLVKDRVLPRDRVFVAQNALDQTIITDARQQWERDPADLPAFQQQHDLDPRCTVVHVSRLLPSNGTDQLVRALPHVLDTHPKTKVVIVGTGPDQDRCAVLASELGVSDSVILTGPLYDEPDLAPWMMSSTLFAYPRNIGLSLLHAFGYSLPVVTCDALEQHNPEIEALTPGVNGLLFRDNDPTDLAQQWKTLFDSPDTRQRMRKAALEQVTEKYSLQNMVSGFLDAIAFLDRTTCSS